MAGGLTPDGALAFLLIASLKAGLVLAAAAALALALRRAPARVRTLVWGMALAGALALPLLARLLPAWPLPLPVDLAAAVVPESSRPAAGAPEGAGGAEAGQREGRAEEGRAEEGSSTAPPPPTPVRPLSPAGPGSWWLALWGVGAAGVLAFQLLGFVRVWHLARRSRPLRDPAWCELLVRCQRRLGWPRRPMPRYPVRLLLAPEVCSPMTWGFVHPVILLPEGARGWSAERREIVLLHELVHIRRGDWPVRVLAHLACAVYWANPLAWLAARRLVVEQELACDEGVLALGTPPSSYAGHLLAIARSLAAPPRPPLPVLDMARRSLMEGRLMSILKQKTHDRKATFFLPAALLMVVLVLALAAVEATSAPGTTAGDPDLEAVLAEMQQLEREMEPFEERMEAVEAEMKPFEERMEALERERAEPFEAEMEALEGQMRPFEERMEAVEEQMRPFEDRMEALDAEMGPFEDRLEAVEAEMRPFEEQMEALEREMEPLERELEDLGEQLEPLARDEGSDPAARKQLQARLQEVMGRMEPYRQRMQAIQEQMRPVMEKMGQIHRELGPHHERMAQIHQEMRPYQERMEAIHREMRPHFETMEAVHERMEPFRREMERFHQEMEPIHRRMEEIHQEMEPMHRRMEELRQRLERSVAGELEARLGAELSSRGVSGEAVSEAARRIADASHLRFDDGRLHLLASGPEVREILAETTGLAAGDPGLEAAVGVITGFELALPDAG